MSRQAAKVQSANLYSPQAKLGIVGGGQLARMLAIEAQQLGLGVRILSERKDDPAAQVAGEWVQGSGHSSQDIQDFSMGLQYITFESEFFPMSDFQKLSTGKSAPKVFPKPQVMQTLQDRRTQKEALLAHGIPTAPYIIVKTRDDLDKAIQQFPKGFVLKKCRGGYDGNGTFYYRASKDRVRLQSLLPDDFIAESFVNFDRELAIIMVRSTSGDTVSFPIIESRQVDSRCDTVIGPVKHKASLRLVRQLQTFLHKMNYVGAIGFELFATASELLVNEVAPRVHNSGHYSQEACPESQFLLHIKAGLGFPLTTPKLLSPAFCMVNILGQSDGAVLLSNKVHGKIHWYGKQENRPGRKLGHINYLGRNQQALLKQALLERKWCKL